MYRKTHTYRRFLKHVITRMLLFILFSALVFVPVSITHKAYALGNSSLSEDQQNSSYGFFVWLSENADTAEERADAEAAVQILTKTVSSSNSGRIMNNGTIIGGSGNVSYQDLINATSIGAEYDATSLDNLLQAIDFISLGNQYRAKEGLAPLKVSSGLMAMAELNANYQNNHTLNHSSVFLALENLAFREIGGTWQWGEVGGGLSDDPYEGWYTEEKKNYDENNGKQTGHYKTLTDRQGKMLITGFGVRDRFVTVNIEASNGVVYPCNMHDRYYSQHFSDKNSMYDISSGVTTDRYMRYLNAYKCEIHGHSWSAWTVTTAPTEESEGLEMRKCDVCGETESRAIARLDHALVRTPAVNSTCTEDGNIEYWTCSNCGKIFKDSQGVYQITEAETVVKAHHQWKSTYTVDKPATCKEEGSRSIHCSVCGAIREGSTETIPKANHSWNPNPTVDKPATCKEEGSQSIHCSVCGAIREGSTETIPKTTTHTFGNWTIVKPATCEQTGRKERVCSVCETTETAVIDATGHSYGAWIIDKDATCTEDGSRHKTCSACSDTVYEKIPAKKHVWNSEPTVDVAATCKEEGSQSIHCSVCGAIREGSTETIPKTTAHTFGDWTTTKQPTTAAKGLKERTCSVCGKKDTAEVPMLPASEALSIKSLWASEHSVGKVKFKWTKKDGTKPTGWNLKYRTRKIGAGGSWSGWTTKSYPASTYEAWINIPVDYVIEIHAQAKGDKTWSTGIITTPAGGKYQAMKTTYVLNTATNKRVGTDLTMKVGETIKVRPDYEYPVKDYNKRPKLYPNQMLYDVSDKTIISVTKPDGSKYTGGMIDGVATIRAAKKGTTQIVFRAPNGRTQVTKITVK